MASQAAANFDGYEYVLNEVRKHSDAPAFESESATFWKYWAVYRDQLVREIISGPGIDAFFASVHKDATNGGSAARRVWQGVWLLLFQYRLGRPVAGLPVAGLPAAGTAASNTYSIKFYDEQSGDTGDTTAKPPSHWELVDVAEEWHDIKAVINEAEDLCIDISGNEESIEEDRAIGAKRFAEAHFKLITNPWVSKFATSPPVRRLHISLHCDKCSPHWDPEIVIESETGVTNDQVLEAIALCILCLPFPTHYRDDAGSAEAQGEDEDEDKGPDSDAITLLAVHELLISLIVLLVVAPAIAVVTPFVKETRGSENENAKDDLVLSDEPRALMCVACSRYLRNEEYESYQRELIARSFRDSSAQRAQDAERDTELLDLPSSS